jgi:hypothetical protein
LRCIVQFAQQAKAMGLNLSTAEKKRERERKKEGRKEGRKVFYTWKSLTK